MPTTATTAPPAPARRPGRRWSERFPALHPLAVAVHRLQRRWTWLLSTAPLARERDQPALPVRVIRHRSLLLRTLGDTDMRLQHNKVVNLRIAVREVDGLLIAPGEEFTFCRTVGRATRRNGYVEGMLLSNGQATTGVDGGICQLANLLH